MDDRNRGRENISEWKINKKVNLILTKREA